MDKVFETKCPAELCEQAFAETDENSDGRVSLEEFQNSMRPNIAQFATEESSQAVRTLFGL